MLFANTIKSEDISSQDFAEAGNLSSDEDLPVGLKKEDLEPIKAPGKRGRQPHVKTCGKNKEVFNHLDSSEQIFDDIERLKSKYPDKQFTYHRTDTDMKIDFIESHNVTRKIITNIYRDQ